MAYIEKAFFAAYTNTTISDSDFSILSERASDVIDLLTLNRIVDAGGISTFSSTVQTAIQKATAAETETLYLNGGVDVLASGASSQGASIGKFSYSGGFNGQSINGLPVSPLISGYLRPTGLLYRGL